MRRSTAIFLLLNGSLGIWAAGPTAFTPDSIFRGSSLTGWQPVGQAAWSAANGEVTAKTGAGWILLDKPLQDAGFFASFRCSGACDTGVMLRTRKTANGFEGTFLSLSSSDVAAYHVTLDAQGQILTREAARRIGGQFRKAPPPAPNASGGGRGNAQGPTLRADDWNTLQVTLDADIVRFSVNGGGYLAAAAEDQSQGFGPIALYAGSREVRFKDISYADLGLRTTHAEETSTNFRAQRISDFYYSWSAVAADVNRDGLQDVVAGPFYYLGPDYTKFREISLGQTVNPSVEYPDDSMMQFAYDFTGDGWVDVLNVGAIGKPAMLLVNPKGEARRWDSYPVVPEVRKEIALFKDVDGDGKPEFLYGGSQFVSYAKPDPANPTGPWVVRKVSTQGVWGNGHGLGVGDINGDGRNDIVESTGWWEQPSTDTGQPWTRHEQAFGAQNGVAGGGEMGVYDVNGDGLADVVTSLTAHGHGLAWFEQKRTGGAITFVEHFILDDPNSQNAGGVTFSEAHGVTFADMDGDGIQDFVVGKRSWSHKDTYTDPDPQGPAVLYVYRTVRDAKAPGGARFVPELVHNRSGAGNTLFAADINGDQAMDILTATTRGTFIFWGKQKMPAKGPSASRN